MRRIHVLCATVLCALASGCETPIGSGFEIWRYSTRNFFELPLESRDDCVERGRHRHEAEAAWKKVVAEHPDRPYSVIYGQGFRDGFADYLYAGGNGQPPVVPPWYYRRAVYETPEGLTAVEDWFAGFKHGAQVAQESGLRELVVVPVSLPGRAAIVNVPDVGGGCTSGAAGPPREAESGESLPPPRPVRGGGPP